MMKTNNLNDYANKSLSKLINQVFLGYVMDKSPTESVDVGIKDHDYNVIIRYNEHSYTRKIGQYIDYYVVLTKELMKIFIHYGNFFIVKYSNQSSCLNLGSLLCLNRHNRNQLEEKNELQKQCKTC